MTLALPLLLVLATGVDPSAEQRARAVLAQAREALGGKRAAVRSFSLEADLRRIQPGDGGETRDLSGELTVDALLPDRYLKVETLSPFPGAPAFSIGTGFEGQQAWRAPVGGGGGPHMVIRVAGADNPGAADALLRRTRAEMLRLMLLVLATDPAEAGLTLAHAGEAEAPEGRAERVDVSNAEGPIGTLFFDKSTHRPLLVSFKAPAPRMQVVRAMGPQDGERAQKDADQRAAAPVVESEARLYVSDWKSVGGVLLPHRLSQTSEGGSSEEWTIKSWKLDQTFKPDHFKKQK